ncbi:hypothetical protein BJF78_22210 [Pseudonocardia sp. CNS-139]|nr:hypothetical protein BJF78_22210 [Pseudonocardia sp. CNS-139]
MPGPAGATRESLEKCARVAPWGYASRAGSGCTATVLGGGEPHVAAGQAVSVPVPAVTITQEVAGAPVRPGQPVELRSTVTARRGAGRRRAGHRPGLPSHLATAACARSAAAESRTVACAAPAPAADTTSLARVTALDETGRPLTATAEAAVAVIDRPAVRLTARTGQNGLALVVTNAGDAPLRDLALDGPCPARFASLAPGQAVEQPCAVPGEVHTARVTAADDTGATLADSVTAPVDGGLISGNVLADRNGNGALDAADGDSAIAGAAVDLVGRTDHGSIVAVGTATGADGRWAFGAPAGTYRISAPQPSGFDDGPEVPGPGAVHDATTCWS